jgi:glycosyltransferase involved in cell wall biosynthesis
LRILIVAESYERVHGGIEFHADVLARELTDLGAEVQRVGWNDPLRQFRGPVDWCLFEGLKRVGLRRILGEPRSVAAHFAIFTHGSFSEEVWHKNMAQFGYRSKVPDFQLRRIFDSLLMRSLLDRVDLVFTLSNDESAEVGPMFKVPPSKLVSVPPFAEVPSFTARPQSSEIQISSPGGFVCAVARIEPRKNFRVALRAADALELDFLLAGPDHGGLDDLFPVARRLKRAKFRYLGSISESMKFQLFREARATLLPSFLEGIPYMVIQSLQVGTPSVCTKFSYLPKSDGLVLCDPTVDSTTTSLSKALLMKGTLTGLRLPTNREVARQILKNLESGPAS